MTPAPTIRPLRPEDEAAVGRIAFETGYFGDSAKRYFPAPALFALLWVGPYFEPGVGLGFVAERGGEVLGYIVGAADPAAYRRALVRVVVRRVWRVLPGPARLLRCLVYLTRAARLGTPHGDEALYPAHLHLNLRPSSRGLGLGGALLRAYLDELEARGVPGVQLSTTTENRAAVALYEKQGLTVLTARASALWAPWLGRPATHLLMVRTLAATRG